VSSGYPVQRREVRYVGARAPRACIQGHEPGTQQGSSREEVLAAARPLPPHDEMLIEDLTDEEERIFVEAILDA
jgi:hypothetical protein